MKLLAIFLVSSCLLCVTAKTQSKQLIKIETNKILCLFSFLEAAAQERSSSPTMYKIIQDSLGGNQEFNTIVQEYSSIKKQYHMKREEFPESRDTYTGSKDFLWIASANAESIDDFSERIIGFLPHNSHQALITCLKEVEPYYDKLIWDRETENIRTIENKLDVYRKQIATLFLKISSFYGTEWKLDIPFKIMLYPIPAQKGITRAIPKGNNLICSFLSHDEESYKHILGIAIHEMCHILYDAQPIALQQNLEQWFAENPSEYSSLAYSYLNEGLATVLGNGWAYQKIHQELDTTDWYSNKYIDGFARAMFKETKDYLEEGKTIDKKFVDKAIISFENKFPQANIDINILVTSIEVFADFEDEQSRNSFRELLFKKFNSIRSLSISSPLNDPESLSRLKNEKTKLIIVDNNHRQNLDYLHTHNQSVPDKLDINSEWIYSFRDQKNYAIFIIINLQSSTNLGMGLEKLAEQKHLNFEVLQEF